MKKRLFVAIEISPRIKKQLVELCDNLSDSVKGIRWEHENNFHLTLKFLGSTEISPRIISETISKKISGHISGFVINFGAVNTFVDTHTVVFVEVQKSEELLRLYHMINNCLESVGFKRDKNSFHPHVTLGRSKTAFFPEISPISAFIEPLLAENICIFESKQGDLGRSYKILDEIPLN